MSFRDTMAELLEKEGSNMASKKGFSNPEAGGVLSRIVETLATAVKATLGVPGRPAGRETQERVPTSPPGGQTTTGPCRDWPNPSSTMGGRPWPPAPPHWH